MRTEGETRYHQRQLDLIAKLIAQGADRRTIAQRLGGVSTARVCALVKELKMAGKIPWQRPDQIAAWREVCRVLVLCSEERARRM